MQSKFFRQTRLVFAFASCALLAAIDLFAAQGVSIAQTDSADFAVRQSMNGMRLSDFGDFTKIWHFVTVTYRKDTGLFRFAYANDKAWQTLQSGSTDFPDGAMLGKIAYTGRSDPAFADSYVPQQRAVYQIMVKDSPKFGLATAGWGYFISTPNGWVLGEDDKTLSAACYACHTLVKDRGYVFSRPLAAGNGPDFADAIQRRQALNAWSKKLPFRNVSRADLPVFIRRYVPDSFSSVRLLGGAIQQHSFTGMMFEIRTALSTEAASSGMPAALIERGKPVFSLVYPDASAPACKEPNSPNGIGVAMKAVEISFTVTYPVSDPAQKPVRVVDADNNPYQPHMISFCEAAR